MRESVCPPQRMRYSFESRCRIVWLILAGESPQAAAAACGASRASGYRLWRRYQEGGWAALADRPSTPKRQRGRSGRLRAMRGLPLSGGSCEGRAWTSFRSCGMCLLAK